MRGTGVASSGRYSAVNVLVATFVFVLTGAAVAFAASPTTVDLGTTENFAILAGTPNITDAGNASVITGNVGLSPATGAGNGLLCPQVDGTIYDVDGLGDPCFVENAPLLTTAKNDLITAYNDAAGRTPVTTVPTELGGTTLAPGVYDSASTTFGITSGAGPLILDAQGDTTGVFIFKMASGATGLTVGPGSTVSLINGAQACNVFWQLNTATIDTTATFKGTILALTSITVANGANIEGRLLARNGNVTLINDTVARPICVSPVAATTPGDAANPDATPSTTSPGLPNTGGNPFNTGAPWYVIIPALVVVGLASYYFGRRNRTA